MAHIGTVGKRIEIRATLACRFEFAGYYGETYLYKFEDKDGNVLTWKTATVPSLPGEEDEILRKGDTVTFKATVKEHGAYKGEDQTVLSRVKILEIQHGPTRAELDEAKKQEQLASLREGDQIVPMSYANYKEHYSDCETVAGSYDDRNGHARPWIDVIVRAGRMVPSGVRGKRFYGWQIRNKETGKHMTFRAVSLDNAYKQLAKVVGDTTGWEYDRRF